MISISELELEMFLLCSFRYALGRRTYVVSDVADSLIKHGSVLGPFLREKMIEDILEAVQTDQAGMDMDKEVWTAVLNHFRSLRP